MTEEEYQGCLLNIYSIASGGKKCDPKIALGMATSAVDRLRRENERYRAALEAVEYWLSDISPSKRPCCFPEEQIRKALDGDKADG